MRREEFENLIRNLIYYNKMIERYRERTLDIVISPKVIDGMPFQNTNSNSDPTNQKATTLAELDGAIKFLVKQINKQLYQIDRLDMKQVLILKYACDLKWEKVAEIMQDENIKRKFFNYKDDLLNNEGQ